MAPWSQFYQLVLPSTPGATDPLMDLELCNAAIEFFRRTRSWCVWLDPIVAQAGVREYSFVLPAMATVTRIESAMVNGDSIGIASYKDAGPLSVTDTTGQAYGSSMGTLVLASYYPAGTQILVQASLTPSRTATGIDDSMFELYANDIAEGAKSRLMLIPGQPFSNEQKAGIAGTKFEDAVATRSTESWRGRSSVRKRVRSCAF